MTPPFAILHVMRAPVGGLFRHVLDLAAAQAERGHNVGVIADALTGGVAADEKLATLAPRLALGVSRIPMSRHLGWSDVRAIRHVARRAAETKANVLHGHGAKGGAYARLARGAALRIYTPHGGSLHYSSTSLIGWSYLTLEQLLSMRTDAFLFESAFGRDTFARKVGPTSRLVRVVHNGLRADEFAPVVAATDATDLVFIGELRQLKGVDVLIDALAELQESGRRVCATVIGDGPDGAAFRERAAPLGDTVRFAAPRPARAGFAQGRVLVVPSRAESLPYIVLEAAAAGLPLIASRVGGIPEIFGPLDAGLVPPDDPQALARAIVDSLDRPAEARIAADKLRARIRDGFSLEGMTDQVLDAYGRALHARSGLDERPALSVS